MRFLVRGRAPEAAKISGLDREPPKNAVHPEVSLGLPARVWGKRYRGAGGFSAGVTFPAVTDFDTLHEFR